LRLMSALVKKMVENTSNGSRPIDYCLNRTHASPNWDGEHMTARGKYALPNFP
jgi:hypothetical protein